MCIPIIFSLCYQFTKFLYCTLTVLTCINLADIFYYLTVKFVVQSNILTNDEYKFLVFVVFFILFIFIAYKFEYETVYWQTSFVGAYSYIRVIIPIN